MPFVVLMLLLSVSIEPVHRERDTGIIWAASVCSTMLREHQTFSVVYSKYIASSANYGKIFIVLWYDTFNFSDLCTVYKSKYKIIIVNSHSVSVFIRWSRYPSVEK